MPVTINPVQAHDELHCQYSGQSGPQDCYLYLDCDKAELSCGYNAEIGNGISFDVYHGRTLRWKIPCLTADSANALMQEVSDEAQAIVDGYECVWDGHNHVGKLTDDAVEAREAIGRAIDRPWSEYDTVEVWDAADWFQVNIDGLTADTTDEELAELAKREDADAAPRIIEGTLEYLTARRDRERERRAELAEAE
nr:hypothetical protein [uncultured Rhodopila sp.]